MAVEAIYGTLPQGWRMASLVELIDRGVASLQTGPFGTALHASAYRSAGTPVVAVLNIGDNRLKHEDLPRVDEDTAQRLTRYRLVEGDILFGRKGAVDRRALIRSDEDGWLQGSDCIRLRFDKDAISPKFISYVLGSAAYREWVIRHAHGATMPSLNQEILGLMPLPIAPIPEQRTIASILGALDDKIELNRHMNETFEEMMRALFKAWFVDFEPVRAKMQRRDTGLPPQLAELFPSTLVDSELGEVPEGWEIRGLDKIANYLNGLALQKYPHDGDESLPVIKIAQLRAGNTEGADRANAEIPSEYVVHDGDVLFSWSGSLEVEIWCGGNGALNQHLFKVTSKEFPKWFYFHWTRHHLLDFQNIASDKATTMGHIQRYHLSEAKVVVPPPKLREAMDRHFAPLLDRLVASRVESRTLAVTRDTLLPKLINGEMRVDTIRG